MPAPPLIRIPAAIAGTIDTTTFVTRNADLTLWGRIPRYYDLVRVNNRDGAASVTITPNGNAGKALLVGPGQIGDLREVDVGPIYFYQVSASASTSSYELYERAATYDTLEAEEQAIIGG